MFAYTVVGNVLSQLLA